MKKSGQLHALEALSPTEKVPGTYCTGNWVGPRARHNVLEKRKIFCPLQ